MRTSKRFALSLFSLTLMSCQSSGLTGSEFPALKSSDSANTQSSSQQVDPAVEASVSPVGEITLVPKTTLSQVKPEPSLASEPGCRIYLELDKSRPTFYEPFVNFRFSTQDAPIITQFSNCSFDVADIQEHRFYFMNHGKAQKFQDFDRATAHVFKPEPQDVAYFKKVEVQRVIASLVQFCLLHDKAQTSDIQMYTEGKLKSGESFKSEVFTLKLTSEHIEGCGLPVYYGEAYNSP